MATIAYLLHFYRRLNVRFNRTASFSFPALHFHQFLLHFSRFVIAFWKEYKTVNLTLVE